MREKALNLLGLMRKAKRAEHRRGGYGRRLSGSTRQSSCLLASDASPNAQKRAAGYMYTQQSAADNGSVYKGEIS